MKKWIFICAAFLLVSAIVSSILVRDREKSWKADVAEVELKDLTAIVSASGTIYPRRSVDVSASTIGKVTRLAVAEGDRVEQGDFLLEIDPTEFESAVRAYESIVHSSSANLDLSEASYDKAAQDETRARELHASGLGSDEQLQAARTSARIEAARVEAARHNLEQQQANLEKARYDLEKVTITAPMSGVVTRLNVEQGENAIMGTLNNPGTVLLVIADLSVIESRVKVDETEVVKLALGQPAEVEIDAFPDTTFAGHVAEIGNSPIYTGSGATQQAVDFEVKVVLDDEVPGIRPGLSSKADITFADRKQVVVAPLGAVVVREYPPKERARGRRERIEIGEENEEEEEREDREGVFVVVDRRAVFRPVKLGIVGQDDFEVLSGLEEGEEIVTGPFRILRELKHESLLKRSDKKD